MASNNKYQNYESWIIYLFLIFDTNKQFFRHFFLYFDYQTNSHLKHNWKNSKLFNSPGFRRDSRLLVWDVPATQRSTLVKNLFLDQKKWIKHYCAHRWEKKKVSLSLRPYARSRNPRNFLLLLRRHLCSSQFSGFSLRQCFSSYFQTWGLPWHNRPAGPHWHRRQPQKEKLLPGLFLLWGHQHILEQRGRRIGPAQRTFDRDQ